MALNKVMLIGNLGRDPEVRQTQSGEPVANFSIATTRRWRDRGSGEMNERTEWHNIVCFSRLAEVCAEFLKKGSQCYIEGELRTRSYEREGQTHYRTEVHARDMQMLGSRDGADAGGREPRGGPRGNRSSDGADAGGREPRGGPRGNRRRSGADRGRHESRRATNDRADHSSPDDDLPF